MQAGFVIVLIALFFFIVIMSNKKSENYKGGQLAEDKHWKRLESIKMEDPANEEVYQRFIEIYKSGEPLFENSLYSKDEMKAINDKVRDITNEHDADFLGAMQLTLIMGRGEQSGRDEVRGLQMNPREKCYFNTFNSVCNTIQKLQRNVSYAGYRANMGGYRVGNFTVNSNDLEGYKVFSAGSLYLTNQRLVFMGLNNKNKVIPISKILGYAPYEQTGILINIANSNPIIFNLGCTGMFDITDEGIVLFNDDKVAFLYAIDQLMEERSNR